MRRKPQLVNIMLNQITKKKIPNKDCPSALLLPTSVGTLSPNNRDQHSVRKLRRSLTQVLCAVSKLKLLCHSCLSCCACIYKLTRRDGVHTTHHSVSVRYLASARLCHVLHSGYAGNRSNCSFFCAHVCQKKKWKSDEYLWLVFNLNPGSKRLVEIKLKRRESVLKKQQLALEDGTKRRARERSTLRPQSGHVTRGGAGQLEARCQHSN